MTYRDSSDEFDCEADLESFLEVVLPQLLASLDMNVMIIGRQVSAGPRCRIDLLAIDWDGTVYVIELKLGAALPETTAQVLDYLNAIENRSPEEFIRLARDEHGIDLLNAFQQEFGLPLPEAINETQHAIVIAQSFHSRTENNLLYLRNRGHQITAFTYGMNVDGVALSPACIEDGESEASSARWPLQERRRRPRVATQMAAPGYAPRIDLQWFWHLYAPRFVADIVLVQSAHRIYQAWMAAQMSEGSSLSTLSEGQFARQLRNLLESSGEWMRVYLLPGTRIDPFLPLIEQPSTRTSRTDGHRIVAYQRKTGAG
ncbi:hypothetical protein SAMN04489806_1127 [Paramicrobacterium humi]|uniref:DUF91 domain-containing protein n=1 Tax=Paramicrobacterium humi TaxID=640635 RepID=A0A1H4KE31_9MICO|nr:hypothetical protein [Microbacterium humi]SEB56707.1 hypothetical protein SAMN04489806_1127 [Microbacterium humi]